mgnify:CR=1 FL=1
MPKIKRQDIPARARAPLALTALLGCVLAGCAANIGAESPSTASIEQPQTSANIGQPAQAQTKPTKIALLLPFAGFGEPAQIARGMKQAAEMALFDANDPSIQLITKDDGGTADGAEIFAVPGTATTADLAGFPPTIMINGEVDELRALHLRG